MNVAPETSDVYYPDRRVNDVDCHIDARNAYKQAVPWGFIDAFRQLRPDGVQYTCWDYFRNADCRHGGMSGVNYFFRLGLPGRRIRSVDSPWR